MNKKALGYIIALMSLSLIGLISLQAYWIWLKVEQTRAEFNANVFQSLSDISQQLEEEEAVVFIQNMKADLFSKSQDNNFTYVIKVDDETTKDEIIQQKMAHEKAESELRLAQRVLLEEENSKINVEIIHEGENDIKREEEILELLSNKKGNIETAINKIALNFAFRSASLSERLEEFNLDSIIAQSLQSQGIANSTFDYMVRENKSDSVILSSLKEQGDKSMQSLYSTPIFTGDLVQQGGGTLFLHFKNRSTYILQTIWLSLLISVLLTGILLYTFSYTVYAILKQKKMSQVKSDFINNMTHEFKTPIATISLAIDSILHPLVRKDEKEIERFGAIIKKENARMNDQIERVLEAAKFEKGDFKLKLKVTALDQTLKELRDSFKLSMQNKSGDIHLVLDAQNHEVLADELHIYNALRNVIENGIKFSPEDFRIRITSFNEKDQLCIRIEDHGIGMDAETQKRAFDRFYRKTEGNIHSTKGFGLGLNYVKEVLEAMGGSISVKSKLKEGSSFSIKLPIYHA